MIRYRVMLETNEVRVKEVFVNAETPEKATEAAKKLDYKRSKSNSDGAVVDTLVRTIQTPRAVEPVS